MNILEMLNALARLREQVPPERQSIWALACQIEAIRTVGEDAGPLLSDAFSIVKTAQSGRPIGGAKE